MNCFHRFTINVFNLMFPFKVYGKENIPKDGGAIFVCNHFRAIDCGFIAKLYSKDIYFLAKKELFKNKLFGKIIKTYGAIPVDRENPDLSSMIKAIKVLKEGHKLTIFPEGTRNKTGTSDLQQLKGGTVLFATKAKVPVIPFMIDKKSKIFHRTNIIVGKPIDYSDYYNKKLTDEEMKYLEDELRTTMIKLQKKLYTTLKQEKDKKNKK